MIRTENLTKQYNGIEVVKKLALQVEQGDIYGFLGPNGAGKTTTIMMLLGLLQPTSGTVLLMGEAMNFHRVDLKKRIGVVSENQYFYGEMTAQEYLEFFGELYGVPSYRKRIDHLTEAVGLAGDRNKKINAYSKGMQQKLAFSRALLHDPELLILDEPVANLDPSSIKQVRDLIEEENRNGRTIFVSSHLLSEVERLCKRVGIIHKGQLLAEDSMDTIKRRLSNSVTLHIELDREAPALVDILIKLDYVQGAEVSDARNRITVNLKTDRDNRSDLSRTIFEHGYSVLSMKTKEMSLEEAFMTITQHNISLLASQEETRP
ncbi:MAG TPA: ABC transporter ATP-binding protein [Atribacteraceae bacterium]|nr:ABC transporter ATP-binding protein [Atribacteraceae bacterium]